MNVDGLRWFWVVVGGFRSFHVLVTTRNTKTSLLGVNKSLHHGPYFSPHTNPCKYANQANCVTVPEGQQKLSFSYIELRLPVMIKNMNFTVFESHLMVHFRELRAKEI